MFIYLSKKIAIPNNTKLRYISWNKEQGYIACGGDDGLLKVLKLESGTSAPSKNANPSSNLSMNQSLEGHSGNIQVIIWNEIHHKLTSSDSNGLIIVWMLYKGSWYEEMINNRNKSVVKDMAWNPDGSKICIVYEDGAVIVGSVDGNRIWGKELKGSKLVAVEWSPDSRLLLFGMDNGEIHIYDSSGGFISRLNVQCLANMTAVFNKMGIHWYNGRQGYVEENCPTLVIWYESGRIQIMKNENDDMPIMIDTMMRIKSSSWNHNGSILAVAGTFKNDESIQGEKESNVIQFYDTFGVHLRTLKIPGKDLACCAWEGTSLRIALAVDSFIYFANIRPQYKWCYFSNTVVYTYTKAERYEVSVVFWDTKNNEKHIKHVKSLLAVAAFSDYCVLATKTDDLANPYGLILCNAIGTPVDSTHIDIEPIAVTITRTHVFAVSKESIFSWQYYTPKAKSALTLGFVKSDTKKEKVIHIDDNPTGGISLVTNNDRRFEQTSDIICCVAASDTSLVVARESGALHVYTLPHIVLTNRLQHPNCPHRMFLNCDSTRLAIIDVGGVLRLLNLDQESDKNNTNDRSAINFSKFERKDVWDMCWAQDNPELLAVMEKTRMYVFRNLDPEEPIISSGYICSFKDLEITAVLMDNLMKDPEEPSDNSLIHLEVKSLRDTRELLEKVGTKEAIQFIEENPHPRLWRLLAKAALDDIDLETSESSFVRCKDYTGIQFVKKLKNIQSEVLRKAEIAAYFQNFKEAERLYIEADRKDLAILLRNKLGDYFNVVQLLKSANVGSDPQLEQALVNMGDYYAERQKWKEAASHYEKGRQSEKLAHCLIMLEDYDGLEHLAESLPDGSPLLSQIADHFASIGLCEVAVQQYKRNGEIKAAVDCCVRLNQWHEAVQLAKENNVQETSELLAKYANHLLEKNMKLQAIELYRKANHHLEAAKLLFKMAEEDTQKKCKPLRIKKLYVLGALLIDEFQKSINSTTRSAGDRSSALMGLNNIGSNNMELLENAWRGAEAYHYYILAQRQLYEGYVDASMKTALHLRDYEDLLLLEDIYALLALASCANRAFGTCSKALTRLESLEKISDIHKEEYENLALDIFTKHVPKDSRVNKSECTSCETLIPDWCTNCPNCFTKFPICIATGRPIMDVNSVWTCSLCKHSASEQDIATRKFCPLCHHPIIL